MKTYTDKQLERAAEVEGALLLQAREALEGATYESAYDNRQVRLGAYVTQAAIVALTPMISEVALTIAEGES